MSSEVFGTSWCPLALRVECLTLESQRRVDIPGYLLTVDCFDFYE